MSDNEMPCPINGKKPSIQRSGPGNLVWYIECEFEGDGYECMISLQSGLTRKEAVAAWNSIFQQKAKP